MAVNTAGTGAAVILLVPVTAPNSGRSTSGVNIFAFAKPCNAGFRIYNDTATEVRYSKNADPCGPGSPPVPAGESVSEGVSVTHLNLYIADADVHLNDGAAASITVEGVRYSPVGT